MIRKHEPDDANDTKNKLGGCWTPDGSHPMVDKAMKFLLNHCIFSQGFSERTENRSDTIQGFRTYVSKSQVYTDVVYPGQIIDQSRGKLPYASQFSIVLVFFRKLKFDRDSGDGDKVDPNDPSIRISVTLWIANSPSCPSCHFCPRSAMRVQNKEQKVLKFPMQL